MCHNVGMEKNPVFHPIHYDSLVQLNQSQYGIAVKTFVLAQGKPGFSFTLRGVLPDSEEVHQVNSRRKML